MALANQRKTFIAVKLKFLTEQKAHLISVVDSYVDQVVAAGNSWADVTENRIEFTDLCLHIDKAIDYICIKCDEISGATDGVDVNQHNQKSAILTEGSFKPASATSVTTEASHMQTSATDDIIMRQVLERIEDMEEAFNSVRMNTGKVADKQREYESQIKEMLSKTSQDDKKQNLKFNEVKEQIMNLTENQTEIQREQKLRFQGLEKQLQKLSNKQMKLDEETRSCTQQMERQIGDVTCEVESVKDKITELNFLIDSFTSECAGRIKSVEKLAGDMSEKVMTNSEALRNLSEKVTSNTDTLGNLFEKVTSSTETLGNLSEKVTSNTETLGNLSEKVTSNTETLGTLFKSQEQNKSSLRKFEAKLLDTRVSSEVSKIKRKVIKIDKQLREAMSVATEELVPRLNLLVTQFSRPQIGFTADVMLQEQTDDDVPISSYGTVHTNVGGHFDPFTGLFTVPIDGLYVVSLFFVTYDNGTCAADIILRPGGLNPDIIVCSVLTEVKCSNAGDLCVCMLKAGDVLFSSKLETENKYFEASLRFSCFRLG